MSKTKKKSAQVSQAGSSSEVSNNNSSSSSASAGATTSAAATSSSSQKAVATTVPKNLIPPLPNPATGSANPAASLHALWGYLQPALDHIVRSPTNNTSKAPPIDVAYHMGIHTAVYNYFTSQSETIPTGPGYRDSFLPSNTLSPSSFARTGFGSIGVAGTVGGGGGGGGGDKGKVSGTDLYEQLDRYYADAAREVFLGTPHDDTTLVHYLVPCFNRFSSGTQSVNRLLNYVNRHYVKRAVDEDKGWLRLADVFDAVAKSIQEDDTREKIQKRLRERRVDELKKWGYKEGGSQELIAQAEASAEAASSLDRVVPLSALGYRRFRIECIDPLLAVPKTKKGKKKKIPTPSGGSGSEPPKPTMPKGRLARAVKELLEGEGGDVEERRRLAGELAIVLRTVGIKVDHPLRKKLDRFAPQL
ncbi:hypothetical protein NLI96_g10992 [Meripilus lineatus]|uniref:Uncharacterized protein n=1 Tax=Meripilus lineatus TaxID=2056292 RepID=A0AAD5USJ8_9APHY|nr:hypothetical protein NLI96_g10992 [Physisporinus lineatus]